MQQQEVEVSFCDLCGTSVPAGDLEGGKAVRHQGKTVGACCLAALRGEGAMAPAAPVAHPPRDGVAKGGAGEGGRLLTVGIVLLAALAATVIFLDSRMSSIERTMTLAQEQAGNGQRANSDVLMGLDSKLDRSVQREDLDAVTAKASAAQVAIEGLQATVGQRLDVLGQSVDGMRGELRTMKSQIVDYRPLFEDLRDRHQRTAAAIEALRGLAAQQPALVVPGPDPSAPLLAKPVGDLPDELLTQVQKLGATDPAVRFEAVDLLVESKNLKVLPYLLPLAKDPDAFVRRLTVEGLRDFKKPESVDALLTALADEDENVRDTAWRSLRDVTDQKFPFEASASKDARARAVQRWQDWWDKAKVNFGT